LFNVLGGQIKPIYQMKNNKNVPMVSAYQVLTTTNYSLFKQLDGNRNLNELHKKRLKQSIESKPLFTAIS